MARAWSPQCGKGWYMTSLCPSLIIKSVLGGVAVVSWAAWRGLGLHGTGIPAPPPPDGPPSAPLPNSPPSLIHLRPSHRRRQFRRRNGGCRSSWMLCVRSTQKIASGLNSCVGRWRHFRIACRSQWAPPGHCHPVVEPVGPRLAPLGTPQSRRGRWLLVPTRRFWP